MNPYRSFPRCTQSTRELKSEFSGLTKYRNQTFKLPNGTQHQILVGQEKGVDIRIALDVANTAVTGTCDVAIVFSQDQDLSEVTDEVQRIVTASDR